MAAPATPYIGAQISLVSKSEIRYEGTLHFVDAEQSTLALKNGEHSTGDVVVADVAGKAGGLENDCGDRLGCQCAKRKQNDAPDDDDGPWSVEPNAEP